MNPLAQAGLRLNLTPLEHKILAHLLLYTGALVRREALIVDAYPDGALLPESNVLEVIISRLRKKIAGAGARFVITTIHGRGYRLDPLPAPEGGAE